MDVYSVIALLTVIATVYAVWKYRKRKDYKYSTLDISGIILNTVLLVMVYPAFSVAGVLLEIGQFATTPLMIFLERLAIAMGKLVPAFSVAGVGASIVLRRKEKPGLSFAVQFAGAVWFGITMLIAVLSDSF